MVTQLPSQEHGTIVFKICCIDVYRYLEKLKKNVFGNRHYLLLRYNTTLNF